ILFFTLLLSLFLTSCNEFLDDLPDNRTEIDSKVKIQKLLVSAYATTSFALLTELSSDNIDDQGTTNPNTNRLFEQMSYWKDVTETDNDDLKSLWESNYYAIAHANEALKAIEDLGSPASLSAQKGEALLTRAYAHFILVNVFSLNYNDKTSATDLGIPYLERPETKLSPKYKRGTVKEVYEKINKDIEEGLPLIRDDVYDVAAYHFNVKASYAFAARFNLYYEKWNKAKEYATVVLGGDPASLLRNWKALARLPREPFAVTNAYIDDSSNLLTQAYGSNLGVVFGGYSYGSRFNHSRKIANEQTLFAPSPWSANGIDEASFNFRPFVYSGNNLDKTLFYKIPYRFEVTDAVAGIGFSRTVLVPFTTDETLLVRAEANIMLGSNDLALTDINTWSNNFYADDSSVTLKEVTDFYNAMAFSSDEEITQKKKLNPKFTITPGVQESMIDYVLQCRRILTLHEGLRWFDIKRYGIEVTRHQIVSGESKPNGILKVNDLRRALQIPKDVITAGLTPNPR
ncbi:MAG: RagB/SusD family nutrient uptake outer membrane protein, partial [Polaribacter sp.]